MVKILRDKKSGHFAGSVGPGKIKAPTISPASPKLGPDSVTSGVLESQEVLALPIVSDTPCPACGQRRLRIEIRLTPVETPYSIAGAQDKFVAHNIPWLICDGCGATTKGKR